MHSLDEIRSSLATHAPTKLSARGSRQAAVAMILAGASAGPDVLLIERARREGDPWSGHMAFPGGRVDPGDVSPRGAAERETLEEVGLDLACAEPLGRLDDLQGHRAAGVPELVISAFVYHLSEPPPLSLNYEVREAFWFPVASLHDAERQVLYRMPLAGEAAFPGIRVGDPERHVVWGLTYRFLEAFFAVLGWPLSDRWGALRDGV